jgi:large subunit ribosomal protein L29
MRLRVQEMRSLSPEELEKQIDESYRELFNLRFRLATRQLTNYNELRNVRKRIARFKTIMREREFVEG